MPAIRRKYHYGNVVISIPPESNQSFSLCSDTLEIYQREVERLPLCGFCSLSHESLSIPHDLCLLHRITGLHLGDPPFVGDWIDYQPNQLMLGLIRYNSILILLNDDRLIECGTYEEVKPIRQNTKATNIFHLKK